MNKTLSLLLRNRLATLGIILLIFISLLCLLVPILPLPDPNVTNPANRLKPPFSDGAFLGTDALGRDLFSRLLWGTRLSLVVGLIAALLAALIGSTIGILAGIYGGRTDSIIMRFIDMLMAFPYILLALAIVAALGPGLFNALIAVAVVNIPFFARNIRGVTVSLAHKEFIDAAYLNGMSRLRIAVSEILPNVLPVIVITLSTTIGWMILETAGLSFLGLGSQPPQADLGSMLGEGRKVLINAPHASIVPGVMIFLIVISINVLGDGIRDALDPRLRSGALSRPAPVTRIQRRHTKPDSSAPDLPGNPVLALDNLHTEFHTHSAVYRAVNGIDLNLQKGECLGIIGESGSGKSVTALSILGLVASPPGVITEGHVWLHGEDTLSMNAESLRRVRGNKVAYIFQDPLSTLHPLFTIGDQMVEAIRVHRAVSKSEAWQHAVHLLEKVRIPNAAARANNYPHELSGGMRQRVSIALALVNDPEVIIADEPTTALDVTVQAQVLMLLKDLQKDGDLSLIFITHDFGVVSQLCDRVAVMYAGKIVETGTTEDILNEPSHPYTEKLMACVPELGSGKRELESIKGLPPSVDELPDGCAFADRCAKAQSACRRGQIALEPLTRKNPGQSTASVRCLFPVEHRI